MFEISLSNYNEMLRYEQDMDYLRALILKVTGENDGLIIQGVPDPKEHVFDTIEHYSHKFATDIYKHGKITSESIDLFHSSMFTLFRIFGITQSDIHKAGEQQRYRNSGFWEMRRCLGQFNDVAEYAAFDGITHIISAAVSGCIIGEYLAMIMTKPVPIDHMIFTRLGPEPVEGLLPHNFSLTGDHILIVDDAVMETTTSKIMIEKLRKISPQVQISLFCIDIDPDTKSSGFLDQFTHVYLPEE